MNKSSRSSAYLYILVFWVWSGEALADKSSAQSEFERHVYRPAMISALGVGAERFETLSTVSRKDVLDARLVIARFFQALERRDGDPSRYLTSQFSRSREEIRKSLVADETMVLQVGISDFSFREATELTLNLYLVLFTDGTFIANEAIAVLEKRAGAWRISRLAKTR